MCASNLFYNRMEKTVKTRMSIIMVCLVASMALAAPAFAASPSSVTYGATLGVQSNGTPTPQSVTANHVEATSSQGSLPFTGLDLVLVAGGGIMLLGLGVAMRRASRGPELR
jgi:hypothetical protein